ncbi:hypothetical protein OG216_19400 [Streptomycetaceae bacterium NBC_01309]
MSWFDWAVDVSKIAGGVGVAAGFLKGFSAWWTTGPGRRKHWTKAYRKIACGVQADYVDSLFGVPPFKLQGSDGRVRRIWVLGREGYLTTLTQLGTVISYSLTTSNPKFNPLVAFGSHDAHRAERMITLGVTSFAAAAPDAPWKDSISLFAGARRGYYCELHYAGNPGGYLYWMLGNSDVGTPPAYASPDFSDFRDEYNAHRHPAPDSHGDNGWSALSQKDHAAYARFRRTAVVNTITVSSDCNSAPDIGADVDTVRVLALAPTWRERFGSGTRVRTGRALAWVKRGGRRKKEPTPPSDDNGAQNTSTSAPPHE